MDVLAAWALGNSRVERLDGGATNETWQVFGESTATFLRKYRTTDLQAVRREHEIIEAVAAGGVLTPRPIPSTDGDTIVQSEGSLFALFDAAKGQQLEPKDLSVAHASDAGRFLAGLHAVTATLPTEGLRSWNLDWEGADWADRVRSTAEHIPRNSDKSVDWWAYERSMDQAAWLDHPDCVHTYIPEFSRQVIHGDYQHANLFFDGERVAGIIDWDTAAAMCRGFEVVRACSFMFQLEFERTTAFIDGYSSTQTLTPAELADGARAWGCFADHHVWAIEERYLDGNLAAEQFIPEQPFRPFHQAWGALGIV